MARKMKDSGIEWIGEIPEDWEISKLKYIGSFTASGIDKKIKANEKLIKIVNYTDVYGNTQFRLYNKDYMTVSASTDQIKQHMVKKGDLIFTPSSETIEDIGVSTVAMEDLKNTAFSYHVLRFRFNNNKDVIFRYRRYLCNNNYSYNYFSFLAKGTTRKTLKRSDFNEAKVILPPLSTQEKISYLLDKELAKIDNINMTIVNQIQTLEDYKKSVITEAVTKGLDKNVEMKDSGIEWIGEIPKHWEIKRLKQILSNNSLRVGPFGSALKSSDIVDSGKWVYNQRTVLDNNFETNDTFIDDSKFNELISFKVNAGDILLTTRGTIGRIAIVPKSFYEGVIHPCIIKFRVKEGIFKNALIKYIFNSTDIVLKQVEYLSNSTTIGVIYSYNLVNIYFPTPPVNEQLEIINYLGQKTATIDEAITAKQKQLEILEEYKKSLIYEYVTGKKEVEDVGTI